MTGTSSDVWQRTRENNRRTTNAVDLGKKEGRKEMFYFNDALNTLYLPLYGRKEGRKTLI